MIICIDTNTREYSISGEDCHLVENATIVLKLSGLEGTLDLETHGIVKKKNKIQTQRVLGGPGCGGGCTNA